MRYWVTWLKRNDHLKKLMFTLYANAQRSGVEKKTLKDITVGLQNKTKRKLNASNLSHFKPRWKGRNDRKCPLIHGNHDLNELYTANSLFCAGH